MEDHNQRNQDEGNAGPEDNGNSGEESYVEEFPLVRKDFIIITIALVVVVIIMIVLLLLVLVKLYCKQEIKEGHSKKGQGGRFGHSEHENFVGEENNANILEPNLIIYI